MKNISKKVFVCNDVNITFEEAFLHHTEHKKNIAIISNKFKLMKSLSIIYAEKHYPHKWKMNISQMVLTTPYGKINFIGYNRIPASSILIHRAFVIYDCHEDVNTIVKRSLVRCRVK